MTEREFYMWRGLFRIWLAVVLGFLLVLFGEMLFPAIF